MVTIGFYGPKALAPGLRGNYSISIPESGGEAGDAIVWHSTPDDADLLTWRIGWDNATLWDNPKIKNAFTWKSGGIELIFWSASGSNPLLWSA